MTDRRHFLGIVLGAVFSGAPRVEADQAEEAREISRIVSGKISAVLEKAGIKTERKNDQNEHDVFRTFLTNFFWLAELRVIVNNLYSSNCKD